MDPFSFIYEVRDTLNPLHDKFVKKTYRLKKD